MVIWITLLNHPNEVWNPYLREVSELNFRVLHRSTLIHFMLELRAPTSVSSLKSIRKLSDFNDRMLLLVDSTDTYIIFMWFCVDLKNRPKKSKNYQKMENSIFREFSPFSTFSLNFWRFFKSSFRSPKTIFLVKSRCKTHLKVSKNRFRKVWDACEPALRPEFDVPIRRKMAFFR